MVDGLSTAVNTSMMLQTTPVTNTIGTSKLDPIGRKIYFYQVDVGIDESGARIPFNATEILDFVATLNWTDGIGSRYLDEGNGNVIALFDAPPSDSGISMALGRTQRTALPQVETGGSMTPLTLADTAGLAELSHIVAYDHNVIAVEFNHKAPRITRLPTYLKDRSQGSLGDFKLFKLLRNDAIEQLNRLSSIKSMQLKVIQTMYSDPDGDSDSFEDEFDDLIKSFQYIENMDFRIRLSKTQTLIDRMRALVRKIGSNERTEVLRVTGEDLTGDRLLTVNLIDEQFIFEEQMMPIDNRFKVIRPESAIRTIDSAYSRHRVELIAAKGLAVQSELL